ncbi:hypothetical protein J1605_014974 [Eschrichtius robustus]|uniref:Uncharacterized protein n=1 Tax=Eschrichtius robustus TaxID=9764 RepID=A0AB34GB89_ESCRO|nr:hypothetical protein J1605_014974 [Eschrichtius robustus]
MKSPVPDLAPSDGEEGEDRTPLLQRAPRAETGPHSPPAFSGAQKQLWSPGGGLDREAGPGRAEARAGPLQVQPRGPRQLQPRGPRQVQPRGPRQVQPREPRQVQPAGPSGELLGAGGAGLPAIFGSIEPGTLWKNELGENLEINGQRAEGRTP